MLNFPLTVHIHIVLFRIVEHKLDWTKTDIILAMELEAMNDMISRNVPADVDHTLRTLVKRFADKRPWAKHTYGASVYC